MQCGCGPVHVKHGWEVQFVVDLLRSPQGLVELKPGQLKRQHRRQLSEPVLMGNTQKRLYTLFPTVIHPHITCYTNHLKRPSHTLRPFLLLNLFKFNLLKTICLWNNTGGTK